MGRPRKVTPELEKTTNTRTVKKTLTKEELLASIKLTVKCKNETQKILLNDIKNNDITICTGPAGCGKTYLACYQSLIELKSESPINKIIIVKSVTTLKNEEVGFLKGSLADKMEPFIYSFIKNFEKIAGEGLIKGLMESNTIETLPIAYMRGINIDNAIVIIDETQNITIENIRTIMTRLGENSKMIFLGDINDVFDGRIGPHPTGNGGRIRHHFVGITQDFLPSVCQVLVRWLAHTLQTAQLNITNIGPLSRGLEIFTAIRTGTQPTGRSDQHRTRTRQTFYPRCAPTRWDHAQVLSRFRIQYSHRIETQQSHIQAIGFSIKINSIRHISPRLIQKSLCFDGPSTFQSVRFQINHGYIIAACLRHISILLMAHNTVGMRPTHNFGILQKFTDAFPRFDFRNH